MLPSAFRARYVFYWAVALAAVAGSADPAAAQFTWSNQNGGNWSVAANWGGTGPTAGGSATTTLNFGTVATQTAIYTATDDFAGPFLLNSLTVNNTSGIATIAANAGNSLTFTGNAPAINVSNVSGVANLMISAPVTLASLDVDPNVTVGGTGTGAVTFSGLITGGLNNLVKTTPASLTLSGGGTMNRLSLRTGNTIISGGTLALTSPNGTNPENTSGVADANGLSGLQLGNASGQVVTATISGAATVNVTENVYIGDITGSTGTLTVTGAGTTLNMLGGASNRLGVGNFGTGTLNVTNGGVVNVQLLFTPREPGASSTITIDGVGSILHTTVQCALSSNGVGNVTVSNGGLLQVDASCLFRMGPNPAGTGTLTITGTGSKVNTDSGVTMGAAAGGTGTFGIVVQNGGTFASGNSIFMGANAGTTSNITVTGAGSSLTNAGHFVVGGSGIPTGGVAGGTATLTVASGGTVSSVGANTTMALFATGTVNVNAGGTLSINSLSTGATGSSGTVNLASGTVLTIADGNFTDSTPVTGPATFAGLIAGAGGIVKNGAGTQTFAGANTYSGGTNVTGGTLTITNAGALGTGSIAVGTGATLNATGLTLTVPSGATLSGAGTVTATTVAAGPNATIRGGAPGTTGTLNVTGTVAVTAGATGSGAERTQVTVDNSTASLVAVTGAVNFVKPAGTDPFVIDIRSLGLTPNVPVNRTILTASAGFQLNGAGPIPAGTAFTLNSDYVVTSPDFASFTAVSLTVATTNTLVLQFTPVPEPVTVLGLASGGAFLFRLRRRVV